MERVEVECWWSQTFNHFSPEGSHQPIPSCSEEVGLKVTKGMLCFECVLFNAGGVDTLLVQSRHMNDGDDAEDEDEGAEENED